MTVECFIYLRVSSSRQVKELNGLESQKRKCIDYCLSKNYKIIQIYREEGVS